jgi:hypothetical protein
MPKIMETNPYDENFLTPMAEHRRGAEPGPDMLSVPLFHPADPLKYLDTKGVAKGNNTNKHGNNKNTAKRK